MLISLFLFSFTFYLLYTFIFVVGGNKVVMAGSPCNSRIYRYSEIILAGRRIHRSTTGSLCLGPYYIIYLSPRLSLTPFLLFRLTPLPPSVSPVLPSPLLLSFLPFSHSSNHYTEYLKKAPQHTHTPINTPDKHKTKNVLSLIIPDNNTHKNKE